MAGRWAKFPMARQGSKRGLGWPAQRSGAQARPFACLSRRPLLVALSIHWLACGGGGGGRWRSGGGVGSYHDASRDGVIRTHRGCAAAWKGSPSSSTREGGGGAACSDKAFEILLFLFDARGLAEGRARVKSGSVGGCRVQRVRPYPCKTAGPKRFHMQYEATPSTHTTRHQNRRAEEHTQNSEPAVATTAGTWLGAVEWRAVQGCVQWQGGAQLSRRMSRAN